MRLVWTSDWSGRPSATGFTRASRGILRYLHERGHEILEVGVGYTGQDQHPFPWPVVGTTEHGGRLEGQDVSARAARDFRTDALILFEDVPDASWAVLYRDKEGRDLDPESIDILDQRKFALGLYAPVDGCRADGSVPDSWPPLFRGMNAFDFFAAPSRFGQKLMGEGASYVPHGIDTEAFSPGPKDPARASLGVPADRFVLLYVAVNKRRKAVPAFFESVGKFMDRKPDAKVAAVFIGQDREDAYHLQGLCDSYHLEERGVLCYHVRDLTDDGLIQVYRMADLGVFPTGSEGFCLPAVEAQATRLPVIVTDYSAVRELVPDDERGFCKIPVKSLIPQPANNLMYAWVDTDAAADRIVAFHDDKGLRMRLRRAAWEMAKEFDIRRTAPMAERWILEAVERNKEIGRKVRIEAV